MSILIFLDDSFHKANGAMIRKSFFLNHLLRLQGQLPQLICLILSLVIKFNNNHANSLERIPGEKSTAVPG
jgi:hypothetical protein